MQAGYVAENSQGYFQVASGGLVAAVALTAIVPAAVLARGPCLLRINCEGQPIRWRDDGTVPTATVGMILPAGIELLYTARNHQALRFIETAASATLNITVYSQP